ncbi:DUF6069 family protein [Arthrobacter globiformis]|uniref:DUF6069 family protein n=1 Tax=Arthrobacter globiformis TaxID=1665 RepID=UPI0027D7B9E0|nr:DUF6069 family protein [Arthrobacter globiformis]
MGDTTPAPLSTRPKPLSIALWLCITILGSVGANAMIASLARAAGTPSDFQPHNPVSYTVLTAAGVLVGALAWAVTRSASKNPRKMLSWLVPAVVAASCIPDLFLLDQGGTAGALAAALMHVAPATIAVPIYRRLLPLPS